MSGRFDDILRPVLLGYQDFRKNSITERIAINYLVFRSPIKYIMTFLPFSIAYLMVTIYQPANFGESLLFGDFNEAIFQEFHLGFAMATSILIALFLLFRWINIKEDGSYGYWISLGISRTVFIIILMAKFIYYIIISYILGLVMLLAFSGIPILPLQAIIQVVQVASTTILLLGIGLFLSEIVKNAPILTLGFISIMTITLSNPNFLFFNLFLPQFYLDISLSTIVIPFLFGMLMLFISAYLHERAEFDLR